MIDTLQIITDDFEVLPGAELMVQPSAYDSKTGELRSQHRLYTQGDNAVFGRKAYDNNDVYNLDITSFRDTNYLTIGCSLPRVANGKNYHPVSRDKAVEVLDFIEDMAADRGVKFDMQSSKLSRVDLFKNVVGRYPFSTYSPIFERLELSRMSSRNYGSTFLHHNTQRELCIYDKLAEMRRKDKTEIVNYPENTIRFEQRYKNRKAIFRGMGIERVRQLKSVYNDLKYCYLDGMKEVWKHKDEVEKMGAIGIEGLTKIVVEYKQKYPRAWYSKMKADFGILRQIEVAGGAKALVDVLRGTMSDRYFRNCKKDIERVYAVFYPDIREELPEGETIVSLYDEVWLKSLDV